MIAIPSPLAGWVTPLDDVPDPVFAERMLGEGIAVDPVDGRVLAPGAGTVSSIHPAGHAVTLALDSGPVLLIHIGLDTVALGGVGFTPAVKDGQRVAEGDLLITFDLDLLARRARSLVTPVIVTNGQEFRVERSQLEGSIATGQPLLNVEAIGRPSAAPIAAAVTVSRSVRLVLAHGLHARPAARLAKAVSDLDATAEIVAGDGRAASARSPVAMLGLGLRHGATLTVKAGGPQAERAVEILVEMLESGMGELQPIAEDRPAIAAALPETPGQFHGIAAVAGLAIGPAWRLKKHELAVPESADDPETEQADLFAARERVQSQLEVEAAGNDPGAAIAAAHLVMIGDPLLAELAQRSIAAGKSAGWAWREAMRELAEPLRASTDARFAERLDDLEDLERRVLAELLGNAADPSAPPQGAIVIADTLYPSQLNALARSEIAGIATAGGGVTSHAAIIAAGLGLPMVVGLGAGLAAIEDGAMLIMQGATITVAPDEHELDRARDEAAARAERRQAARGRAHEQTMTADGTRIEVFANLGSVADAEVAVAEGAEGCGLLRTELLFLDRNLPPDEGEQRAAYQQIADALGERPLIVRTLDIGADKPAPWLSLAAEDNPALGLRGIRLQLARPDLLETQFRALLGVRAPGPLRIMLPMVSSLAEVRDARALLDRLSGAINVVAPELGIMVETPAAALIAATLAKEAAFFSIGTNDLSQYALARDRTNPAVAAGLDALDPAVLRLIDETVRGANAHERVTGVCGGLAATPEAVPVLLGLGVTELSVPAAAIAETKAIVRSLDLAKCRALAAEALAAPDAESVHALASALLEHQP
ncbi:MAG: multiphosphoryl transfer protein [Sphingomonadales bacterium]|jgi:phosphocarrier protein FPr/phosphocarrier protein|nr:multiphosphoryl transfer protein [Sphingomonadales bacterium]